MDTERLFDIIQSKKEYYLNFLKEIAELESPTSYKEGVDKVGRYFIERAKERNWRVEVFEQETAGNVIAVTMNPNSDKKPFCISGHMDTVHTVGSFGETCVRFEENKMIGPGVCDCKGGCVAGFWAMEALSQMGYDKRPVILLLQSDEETSGRESKKKTIEYIVEKSKDAVAFLNLEACYSKTGVTLERKGIAKFEFSVFGISEHASKCYDGASAIAEAANKILELEKYKEKNGITCNCGTIQGGTVPNVVPERCVFTLDVRFSDAEQYGSQYQPRGA